jgi:hypothetical protein
MNFREIVRIYITEARISKKQKMKMKMLKMKKGKSHKDEEEMEEPAIEESRKSAGYKAMAKSAGTSVEDTKQELHKLKAKGVIADIKKRAKGATNPDAYLYGSERKILKAHAAKKK